MTVTGLLRAALAAAVAVAALVPVAEASAAPTVTIIASRSSYTTLTVPRAITLDVDAAKVSGGGAFAGFALQRSDGESTAALLWRTSWWSPLTTSGGELAPGTYRLHVAALAPVRISVPVRGIASATWRASKPLTLTPLTPTWTATAGPSLFASAPITLTTRSVAVFLLGYRASSQGEDVAVCVTSTTLCGSGGDLWRHNQTTSRMGIVVDQQQGLAVLADRPATTPGTYTARWQILARGIVTQPTAAAYVLG